MKLTEKSAYIKGLAEGLAFDKETKEGKIIAALLELVDDMANAIANIQQDIEEIDEDLNYLNEYVEELDDDLQDVEDYLDEECELEDEDYEDEEWEECDGDCTACDGCDCEDDDYCEIVCPSCGETVCFDESVNAEDLICPACQSEIGCIVDDDDVTPIED